MFAAQHIPYTRTNAFSPIVIDYLDSNDRLKQFYSFPPAKNGIAETIELKKRQPVDRQTLVKVLEEQYTLVQPSESTRLNITSLLEENTFTITTAHQPNLFTGPLYFIYKILHAIRLADEMNRSYANYHFVPVYYMGSEDADFAELNHTYINGSKLEWKKEQKGAVGKMTVDATLLQLISEMEGQLSIEPHGNEVIELLRKAYTKNRTIQEATFELVNGLYGRYGLVVLIPDHPLLKAQMQKVFEAELFDHTGFGIVTKTSHKLEEHYEAQAHAREINLFYLKDDIRERIEKQDEKFVVLNTGLVFSDTEIKLELAEHPERFSPNVILRGLYQETILPNLAFVGGGGELAYWLQLKELFDHYNIVFPVLVLRNSFLIIEDKWKQALEKLNLQVADLFIPPDQLLKRIVTETSANKISLNGNFEKAEALFDQIQIQAGAVDATLLNHVSAIKTKALKTLKELEKKMYRAEKRKFSAQQNQLQRIRQTLFPQNGLQERVENFSSFYAKWGPAFIEDLYDHSPTFRNEFTILTEQGAT